MWLRWLALVASSLSRSMWLRWLAVVASSLSWSMWLKWLAVVAVVVACPPATAEGLSVGRTDIESATVQSKELRRKQRMKWAVYFAAFIVFQTIDLVVFELTVMRVKSPNYRLRSITIDNLTIGNATTANSPSFNMSFTAEFTIKNKNFGPFKFENSNITFSYRGRPVGAALISPATAGFLSTKKMSVGFIVSSNAAATDSNLASGELTLNSYSKVRGKVLLLKVLERKKSAEMKCTMTVNLAGRVVQDLICD
ncbi:hypothetical protein F0562_026674 [Nyssa sinensis]|uniref:Uncharacterized protein n=1 Tax=Nyssa sinensis TaxID=561372 RepID=A0A5J5BDL2_9ASTE|nr:hypothetical protein F0562_026674 [Nyssa sinensis]